MTLTTVAMRAMVVEMSAVPVPEEEREVRSREAQPRRAQPQLRLQRALNGRLNQQVGT